MHKYGLIERIFVALGLDDGMLMKKYTPSEVNPLVKYKYGHPAHGQFSYCSVVGMMMYLAA